MTGLPNLYFNSELEVIEIHFRQSKPTLVKSYLLETVAFTGVH